MTDDTAGRIVSARVANPGAIAEAAAARARRPELTGASERLFIIVADHRARGSLGAGADPMAIAMGVGGSKLKSPVSAKLTGPWWVEAFKRSVLPEILEPARG